MSGSRTRVAGDCRVLKHERRWQEACIPVSIEGRWIRGFGHTCADSYPSELFFAADVYSISQDPALPAGPIGGGDYRISDGDVIELMAPNDAMVRYTYSIDANQLVLVDAAGCRVVYLRK